MEGGLLLGTWQNVLIVLAAIVFSLGFWLFVRKVWPPQRRREHNDITGWQVSVLGTTYAVIIGFMLFAVWSYFQEAEKNAASEASCLVNLYWATSGLPQPQREELRSLARDYADAMITSEWPAMNRGTVSPTGTQIMHRMWSTTSTLQNPNASEQASLDQTMTLLSSITQHRRVRQLQSQATLPRILWAVLIVGALITIMSACLFGSELPSLHLLQIVTLALLLSLSLVAIADINRPFQGQVRVTPEGFENARHVFEKYADPPGVR
jgi:hypothetical protein